MNVLPPSVETDAPEMLMGLALRPRESLYATTIWLGLSGLAAVYVSDCVTLGEVSVPVTRSTSPAPKASGANMVCNIWPTGPRVEVAVVAEDDPPSVCPQAIMIAPA